MRMSSALVSIAISLCSGGCAALDRLGTAQPERIQMPVIFEVVSNGSEPVQGARIASAGSQLGVSDASGRVHARLRGLPGERSRVEVHCPAGYRDAVASDAVVIRPFIALEKGQTELRVPVACEPTHRAIALVVRAEHQPGLPVLARGQELARTDEHGVAHVLLSAQPGEEIAVELSTKHEPRLRPQNPRRQFQVSDRDDVFVMSEKFSLREPPRPRKPRIKREPAPELPYAL